jgi:ribonucleoside-diphosphate reductase alpha subunit
MRVAIQLFYKNGTLDDVLEYYKMLSNHSATHASPTCYNACIKMNQLSSCMLLTNSEDSIDGIYKTLKDCAVLSAATAGIGISVSNIRAKGSLINTTKRASDGIMPFLKVHNTSGYAINQGGKRNSSTAIYIEPWHADFLEVIENRMPDKHHINNLFIATWLPNLLHKRVLENGTWSMFCPNSCPKLFETYGDEFDMVYIEYENLGLAKLQVPAKEVYMKIAMLMFETGLPYNLNKDACNYKSNLKNVTPILHSSNLCAEILIPSSKDEIGVCMLASINLMHCIKHVEWENGSPKRDTITDWWLDYINVDHISTITKLLVRGLNNVIDDQLYLLPECENSSKRHRPIGVGVQGMANVLHTLGIEYESEDSAKINAYITELIAYSAITESADLAELYGSYDTFEGSPASLGKLQPHLWDDYYDNTGITYINGKSRKNNLHEYRRLNWDNLAEHVKAKGLRNSLLIAYMPTASTSQLLGNYQSFEPANSNIFSRHTSAGSFNIVNKTLVKALKSVNMWNKEVQDNVVSNNGSISNLPVPNEMKNIFKTVWEMKQTRLMEISSYRGQFICQTQSLNVYIKDPTVSKFTSLLAHGMILGLKTISYYTHSQAAADPVKITVKQPQQQKSTNIVCDSCSA